MKIPPKTRTLLGVLSMTGLAAVCVWLLDGSHDQRLALLAEGWKDRELSQQQVQAPQSQQPPLADQSDPPLPGGHTEPIFLSDEEIGITNESISAASQPNSRSQLVANEAAVVEEVLAKGRAIKNGAEIRENKRAVTASTDNALSETQQDEPQISSTQFAEVQQMIESGEDIAALKKLSAWYWNHPAERPRFQRQIEDLANSIYLSPQPLYEEVYIIQPGDQLRQIAQQYKLSWKYLARLNRVNPRKIRAGQKLKVVRGPFDAVIELSGFQLTVLCQGLYVRSYRVGIGKDGSSPIGKFTVKDKLEDPVYYGPDGVIANDDPQNPLGERWIDIGDSFGIHGTIDPESIGKSESRGCIRMLNADVEEVYDFLTVGSTVWIRR